MYCTDMYRPSITRSFFGSETFVGQGRGTTGAVLSKEVPRGWDVDQRFGGVLWTFTGNSMV